MIVLLDDHHRTCQLDFGKEDNKVAHGLNLTDQQIAVVALLIFGAVGLVLLAAGVGAGVGILASLGAGLLASAGITLIFMGVVAGLRHYCGRGY